jgi:hypothetical protein
MMKLTIPDPYGMSSSKALDLAADRNLWPTALGSREIAEVPEVLKSRAVFSARTTNARYLAELKTRVERYLAAGYKGDKATLRVELKRELRRLGYSPLTGFPGDEGLGIPPAEPGSLRDLSSDRRINLILDTQLRLMTGKAQRAAGLSAMAMEIFPAWELVRTEGRRIPRDWPNRWVEAGGTLFEGRMIALKDAEVWSVIGDPAIFADALGVDHPPFAHASGMGWQGVDEEECLRLGVLKERRPVPPREVKIFDVVPEAVASTKGMDEGVLAVLKRKLGKFLQSAKRITWRAIFGREEVNAGNSSGARKGWETRRKGRSVVQKQKANARQGMEALKLSLRGKKDVLSAMELAGLGVVDFMWGDEGDHTVSPRGRSHVGGWGISHVKAKREAVLKRLPVVLARGSVIPHRLKDRRYIRYAGDVAILERYNTSASRWRVMSFIPDYQIP